MVNIGVFSTNSLDCIEEVTPCFGLWNDDDPIPFSRSTREGQVSDRRHLLALGPGVHIMATPLSIHKASKPL